MAEHEPPAGKEHEEHVPGKKTQDKLAKNKWLLIGGLGVIAVAVWYFTSQSNKNAAAASQTSTAQQSRVPPGGGYYTGGIPGRGPRGPRGPAGHPGGHGGRGPRGKPGGGPSGGPERQWLEQQLGTNRPWTYLEQHDEWVKRLGPGRWQIVKN